MKKPAALLIAVSALLLLTLAATLWKPGTRSTEPRPIRDTMLHAVDHYRSLDARYVHRFLATAETPEQQVSVEIVREPGIGAAATLTRADGGIVQLVTDGRQLVAHDLTRDEYTVTRIDQPSPVQVFSVWDKLLIRFKKGEAAANFIALQPEVTELPLGWASTAIFPQQWILGTYDDSQVLDQGQEELLGRATRKLEVIAPNGRTFGVNADQETGVLLRMEFRENGKVLELLQATRFQVNGPVDRSQFSIPDLTGKRVRIPGG